MTSIVKTLKLLSDPTRLRLLILLRREDLTVAEIQEILGMGQSRISTHLAQLRSAGLVSDRRAGKNIFYGWRSGETDDGLPVIALLSAAEKELPGVETDSRALDLVLSKRQDRAQEYFNRLAGRFGRSHCPGRSWQALSHLLFDLLPPVVIADLGAGEGTLSQLLARRAEKVIAIDNSEKMVEFGARVARENGFANLEYRMGDIQNPPIDAGSVDIAIFSQALHHAVNPARAVAGAARILKPGGRLLILDLLSHNFEESRELYADLWLGFSEVELHRMLQRSDFQNIEVRVVAKEEEAPFFQTIFCGGTKPSRQPGT